MSNSENMKIINSDLLQYVDLDEWEVVNENQIRNKNEKLNIKLDDLSEDYNDKINNNSINTTPKSNYKKSINLTIEIPKASTEPIIQKPKIQKINNKNRIIIKDIEDIVKKKTSDDIIDLLTLLPENINIIFAIKAFEVNEYHVGDTLDWIFKNDREAQSLKRMINRRFKNFNKSMNKNVKSKSKFYIWLKKLFSCKRNRSKIITL